MTRQDSYALIQGLIEDDKFTSESDAKTVRLCANYILALLYDKGYFVQPVGLPDVSKGIE